MKLSALYVARNEEDLVNLSVSAVLPYVDDVIFCDNESEDNTIANLPKSDKIKIFSYPKEEVLDMGKLRSFALSKVTCEFFLAVDCDEIYTQEAMKTIRAFVENPGEAISARVRYSNLAWRSGYRQFAFSHFPDRVYKTEVVDRCSDVLPLDMWKVKREYLDFPNKTKGNIGPLEYDSEDDSSIEHRKQPILDAWYYHLARTRGYNFEYEKNSKYQKNMHPDWSEEECRKMARINHWTSGLYDIEKIDVPYYIPTQNIKNPKVSVIITNYNYNEYLPESVGSIKNQTYPAHEIIIVDDCSRVKPEIEGVKILQQKENRGVSECRNWGIYESTGDYYICLDADDVLEPNFIEETLKEMKGDIQIVYTNYKVFGEANYECNYGEFSREKLKEFQTIPSCCALIDRHCFELSGGYSNEDHWEDYGYWLRLSNLGFNFKRVDQFLFNYRRHAGSRIDLLDQNKEEKLKEFKKMHNL